MIEQGNDNDLYLIAISGKTQEALYANRDNLLAWLKSEGSQYSMNNIQYTLLIGRSHFQKRCAFIVKNQEDLINKLNEVSKSKHVDGYYYSSDQEKRVGEDEVQFGSKLLLEIVDERIKKKAVEEDKLISLAQLYVRGYDIPEEQVSTGLTWRRVPIPTYTFSKEKYWIKSNQDTEIVKESHLHTLIDCNCSTFEEEAFSKTFSGNEFFLRDHCLGNDKVLPGVAYLEMVRVAASLAKTDMDIESLENIVWLEPIQFNNGRKEYKIKVSLFPIIGEQNKVKFIVTSHSDNEEERFHSQGELIYGNKEENLAINNYLDIESVYGRCNSKITKEECYQQFASRGLNLGSTFQSIIEIQTIEDREAISKLCLPNEVDNTMDKFLLHPSLLDGCLQTVISLAGEAYGSEQALSLPYAVEKITIFRPFTKKCYAHVLASNFDDDSKNKVKKYNVDIVDEEGNLIIQIKNFSLKVLQKQRIQNQKLTETLYYITKWKEEELLKNSNDIVRNKILLVFDNDTKLKEEIEGKGYKVILVIPGNEYKIIEPDQYKIRLENENDFSQLIKQLKDKNIILEQIIFHLGLHKFDFDKAFINEEVTRTIKPIIFLTKGLVQYYPHDKIKLLYLYEKSDDTQMFASATGALLKTICRENSSYRFSTLGLFQQLQPYEKANIVINELIVMKAAGLELAYNREKRFCKTLVEMKTAGIRDEEYLKNNGVYIITGGMGALGQKVVKVFTKKKNVKLVLIGKSKQNGKIDARIKELSKNEAEIVYFSVDLSNKEAIEVCIGKVKEQYGKINGVIHCAGVNRDAMVKNKTVEQIDAVLKGKVYGTVNLDEALKDETLEFFIMFSSIAAVFGNPGQADYAFANGFMNGYAQYRNSLVTDNKRFGRTCAIDWPLWKNGGITVDEKLRQHFEDTIGIQTLEDEIGMQMFEECMQNDSDTILAIRGEHERFANTISTILPYDQEESKEDLNKDITVIHNVLFNALEDLLKVKKKDINLHTELSEYGFNSLTFTEFANTLNSKYKLNIAPTLFFEHSTLESLANYLYENYKGQFIIKTNSVEKNVIHTRANRLEAVQVEAKTIVKEQNDEIAIVGISGVFPKSDNLDELWNNLASQKNLVSEIPHDRWDWNQYIVNTNTGEEMLCTKWGGFMNEVKGFDPAFFGIIPREAEKMDPQQKLFLEAVWNTIEDAGYKPTSFSGSNTGVYVGVSTADYNEVLRCNGEEIDSYTSTGLSHCILVNRVSYLLNLKGPSIPVDTACSSSLIAIHQAIQGIQNGDCDMAIAGGVNVILAPMLHVSFGKAGMLSEDGSCKSFDKDANGYVRGEGVGTILLKKLDQAKKDGDHIYAIVKATDVNHGGHVNTLTTPNPKAQTEVVVRAYEKANIDPSTVTYIEAHGTGTKLGDPIEINALKNAFSTLCAKWNKDVKEFHCGIGTIKSNMGHLEAAAGIAGVLKVILSMKYRKIPGNLHFNELNPYIDLKESPFYIMDKTRTWNNIIDESGIKIPRRAGISSFGFGGANAHVVLEEYIDEKRKDNIQEEVIIAISAKTKEMLKVYAENIKNYIQNKMNHSYIDLFTRDIVEMVADLLKVDAEDINKDVNFQEYGLDYTGLVGILKKINQMYLVDIDLSIMSQINSISELSECLYSDFEDDVNEYYQMNSGEDEISLRALSYTLQVGREAYKHRIAFIVNSLIDVELALTQFCADSVDDKTIYYGFIEEAVEEKEFSERELTTMIREHELESIIKLWIKGKEIDWTLLYGEHKPTRISLPAYPFDNQYCWFDRFQKKQKKNNTVHVINNVKEKFTLEKTDFTKKLEENVNSYVGNEVTLEIVNNEIAVVTLCDKENRNMFGDNLIYGLISKFNEINNNDCIKVVVITGSNGVFSMGGTQKQLMGIANETNKFSDVPFLYRGLLECKVPVISAMQGHASGGGMLFGLYADIIVMSEQSIYSASFTKYGFTPGMGATCILRERFGASLSAEMMFTAKSYKGSELKDRGASILFTKKEEVLNEAISIATMLCEKPRETLVILKQELASRIIDQLPNAIEREEKMHRKTFSQSEVKEKIEKFYSKTNAVDDSKLKQEEKLQVTTIDELLRAINDGRISPEEAVQYHF